MSVADDQWNEELSGFGMAGLSEFADAKQKTAKKSRAAAVDKDTPVNPKLKLQQERAKEKFSQLAIKFNEVAAKVLPSVRVSAAMVIAMRTIYKKADLIYKSLPDPVKKALTKVASAMAATMAKVSSRFTDGIDELGEPKSKKEKQPAFLGVRRFLGEKKENIKDRLTEKAALFNASATGIAINRLASSVKGFTKKSSSFFSSIYRYARKPLDLLGGGGIFDMLGKAVGFAALASMVVGPILSGVDKYLTKQFGTEHYIQKMIKDVWDSSWSKLKDEVRKFLGLDSVTVNRAEADVNRRTARSQKEGVQSFDSYMDAKDYEDKVRKADDNPTQENKAAVEKAKVKMVSSSAKDANNLLTVHLKNLQSALVVQKTESILTSPWKRAKSRWALTKGANDTSLAYAAIPAADITPENQALYISTMKELEAADEKNAAGALKLGVTQRDTQDASYQKNSGKSVASTVMKPPVVQGGNVTVTADKEPMETSGGVTAEKPLPQQQKQGGIGSGSKSANAGGIGLSAATVPTSAVGDNLVLLNSGVLS